jgi:hypothetical protein
MSECLLATNGQAHIVRFQIAMNCVRVQSGATHAAHVQIEWSATSRRPEPRRAECLAEAGAYEHVSGGIGTQERTACVELPVPTQGKRPAKKPFPIRNKSVEITSIWVDGS